MNLLHVADLNVLRTRQLSPARCNPTIDILSDYWWSIYWSEIRSSRPRCLWPADVSCAISQQPRGTANTAPLTPKMLIGIAYLTNHPIGNWKFGQEILGSRSCLRLDGIGCRYVRDRNWADRNPPGCYCLFSCEKQLTQTESCLMDGALTSWWLSKCQPFIVSLPPFQQLYQGWSAVGRSTASSITNRWHPEEMCLKPLMLGAAMARTSPMCCVRASVGGHRIYRLDPSPWDAALTSTTLSSSHYTLILLFWVFKNSHHHLTSPSGVAGLWNTAKVDL